MNQNIRIFLFGALLISPQLPALNAAGVYARPLYESEEAVLSGAVSASSNAGFSGSGYVTFPKASGDSIEFHAIMPLAGSYYLECRYAKTSTSSLELKINGAVAGTISFAPTASDTTWAVSTTSINLVAGDNVIKLTSTGTSGPNLDKVEVAYKFLRASALPVTTEMPDPFKMYDGSRVSNVGDWEKQRHYIKEMLQFYQYGKIPPPPKTVSATIVPGSEKEYTTASGKKAYEKKVILSFNGFSFNIKTYHPQSGRTTYPTVALCSWGVSPGLYNFSYVNLDKILERGYGVANFYLYDIADRNSSDRSLLLYSKFPGYDFGAVGAWAYALSRVVDHLQTEPWVDKSKIAASGWSRTGKAALCATIYDERIAIANPSGSGCGGAGCYRIRGDKTGLNPASAESIKNITTTFPNWFNAEFKTFSNKETRLPYDLHFGKAACAPRGVISTDAMNDAWANPYGTQMSFWAAREVYQYLGFPNQIAAHYREGVHNHTIEDMEAFLDFCDDSFYNIRPTQDLRNAPKPNAAKPYTWVHP